MAERKVVDWERVEIEYRANIMSLAELAETHGISKGRICQVAKEKGWARDLRAKILAKAEDKLNRVGLNEDLNAKRLTESAVVEKRSTDVVEIRLSHRTDIQRSKRIANKLMAALEALSLPEPLEDDASQAQRQQHSDLTADVLKAQAGILKQLVDTQKVIVSMEREAFGIAQMVEPPEVAPVIDHADAARRLAFVLVRAAKLQSEQKVAA